MFAPALLRAPSLSRPSAIAVSTPRPVVASPLRPRASLTTMPAARRERAEDGGAEDQYGYDFRGRQRRFRPSSDDSSDDAGGWSLWWLGGLACIALPLFLQKKRDTSAEHHSHLEVEKAELTFAPEVPAPIKRSGPRRVQVDMEAVIARKPLDNTHFFEQWTFNGAVPGPFIRARVGDVLDVTLLNTDQSGMQHNIDFHAVTGPGGGAGFLTADMDETRSMCAKLLHPGLFVYHCAVAPVGWHIGNGMYGLILVEPEEGMPHVDREYYVMQGEFYVDEDAPRDKDDPLLLPPSYERGLDERPNYVVFNGRVGSLVDELGGESLKAKAGERVRIYFGNAGPNLVSSFHVIGAIFDKVYREADLVSPPARSLQTTVVGAGSATVVEMEVPVPGTLTLVDHSIWRIEKGAVGFLTVEGAERPDLFHSDLPARPCEDCKLHP